MDLDKDTDVIVFEAVLRIIVTDPLDRFPGNVFIVDAGFAGDFAGDIQGIERGHALNSDMRVRVFFEICVQDRVGDLVTDLVRMSGSDAFRSNDLFHICCLLNKNLQEEAYRMYILAPSSFRSLCRIWHLVSRLPGFAGPIPSTTLDKVLRWLL